MNRSAATATTGLVVALAASPVLAWAAARPLLAFVLLFTATCLLAPMPRPRRRRRVTADEQRRRFVAANPDAERARHEARHAVAAHALGVGVVGLDIIVDTNTGAGGRCQHRPTTDWNVAVIALASQAEGRDNGDGHDRLHAAAALARVSRATGTGLDELHDLATARARALLDAHRGLLDHVTAALESTGGMHPVDPALLDLLDGHPAAAAA